MKKSLKLAFSILARLLKDDGRVTVTDVNNVIASVSGGVHIITDQITKTRFTISVPESKGNLDEKDANILVYINSNSKIDKILERIQKGGQEIKVEMQQEKVLVHYQNETGDTRVSFNMVGDFKNVGVFGIAHLLEDYGFSVHALYLQELFSMPVPKTIRHDYELIAGGSGDVSSDTIFSATRYLYDYYIVELNKKLEDNSSQNYFIFINRLITGITKSRVEEDEFEIIIDRDSVIKSINYQALFEVLKYLNLRAIVGEDKSPMIKIIDTNSNKLIFQIRTKKETYKTSPTGYRYKIYLEPGAIMEMILNSTENL